MNNESKISKVAQSKRRHLRLLARDERGMSTVEYVILLAVIVVGAIGLWQKIGGHVFDALTNAEDKIGDIN